MYTHALNRFLMSLRPLGMTLVSESYLKLLGDQHNPLKRGLMASFFMKVKVLKIAD